MAATKVHKMPDGSVCRITPRGAITPRLMASVLPAALAVFDICLFLFVPFIQNLPLVVIILSI